MAKIAYEDFSGTTTPVTSNPYDGIIHACNNNPVCIDLPIDFLASEKRRKRAVKLIAQTYRS